LGDRVKKLKGAHAGTLGVVVDVHEGGAVRVKLDHVTRITNKQSGTNFEKQPASAASPPKKQGKEETKEEEQQQEEGGEKDNKETKKKTAKKKRRLFAFVGRVNVHGGGAKR
jgi:Mg-chelatase subunit ChlI